MGGEERRHTERDMNSEQKERKIWEINKEERKTECFR